MGLFKGSEIFSLDNKGRVNIPAKMRKCIPAEAESTFIVSRGLDQCIFAYPRNIWNEKIEPKLQQLDPYNSTHRIMLRKLTEWTEEVELDGNQKMTIPKELLDFANIENKVKLIGMVDHIELWDPKVYTKYINSDPRSYEEVAEQVMTGNTQNEKTF